MVFVFAFASRKQTTNFLFRIRARHKSFVLSLVKSFFTGGLQPQRCSRKLKRTSNKKVLFSLSLSFVSGFESYSLFRGKRKPINERKKGRERAKIVFVGLFRFLISCPVFFQICQFFFGLLKEKWTRHFVSCQS